jgi:uncharacterized membrane protein YfcA
MSFLIAIPLGLLIGVILGLVGAGGSIIAVPALIYGVGLGPKEAIPASLIIVGLAALSGLIPKLRGSVDWSTAAIVGIAGIPAAWAGTAVNRLLNPDVLLVIFAVLMIIAAVRMFTSPTGSMPSTEGRKWGAYLTRAGLVGLTVGFLTGLLGIGGGFVITPALVLLLKLSMRMAVGTSLAIIVINSAAGFTAHVGSSQLNWPLVLIFAAAAIVGSLIASRFAIQLPERAVKVTFAVLVLTVAVFILIQSITALVPAAP